MNEISNLADLFISSLRSLLEQIASYTPSVIGAIVIILVGWLFAKLISAAVSKILKVLKFDHLADSIQASEYLEKANITATPSQLVGKFAFWIIILMVLITASEILGWVAITREISRLINYLPNLFIAVVIFIVGVHVASFIRDIIYGATGSLGIATGRVISTIVYYLLFIIVLLTALKQAGIDTSIVTSNLLLIVGSVLLAAAISYGLASKDVLSNILAGYFSKNIYKKGMKIEVAGVKGTVVNVSNIGITIKEENGDLSILPTSQLLNQRVKILEQ